MHHLLWVKYREIKRVATGLFFFSKGLLPVFFLVSFSCIAQVKQPSQDKQPPQAKQPSYPLQIVPLDKDTAFLRQLAPYKVNFTDTLSRTKEVKKAMKTIYSKGYLFASIDSTRKDSLTKTKYYYLKLGPLVKWARLKNGNVEPVLLEKVGFKEKLYDGHAFKPDDEKSMEEAILTYCENNGFPFARVWLDSVKWNKDSISAKLFLQKNKLIIVDSIHIIGNLKVAKSYLYNYIGFKPGTPYNEQAIRKINSRLQELPFLEQERNPTVIFNNDRATINLYLKAKTASNFDLVIGVVPNNTTTGKLLLTGDGSLILDNALGRGETINMKLDKLQDNTTNFTATLAYPFLFSLPFGVTGDFELYKDDSLYLNLKEEIGIQYLMKGSNYIKAFYTNNSSTLLTVDTNTIKQTHQLPSVLDLNNNFYGLEMYIEKLDYRPSPHKGWAVKLTAAVGERTIKKNSQITNLQDPSDPGFNFNTLYDTLKLKTNEYKFDAALQSYIPLSPRNVFKLAYAGGMLLGQSLLSNELYRIGGTNLLRGFDEQSIYASWYNVFTAEYRYLLSKNSYFFVFTDGAYYENDAVTPIIHDTPIGFGAGITFETKAGIFGVSYALGKQFNVPVELRNAKIQFGYVNLF